MRKLNILIALVALIFSALKAEAQPRKTLRSYDVAPTGSISFDPQEPEPSILQYVPVIGTTYSNLEGGSGNYSFSNRTGYVAGLGILIGRGDLQLETGINYAERGAKESYSTTYQAWDLEYKNKYLEIPLLARVNYQVTSRVSMFAKAGVVYAMLQDSEGSFSWTKNYYGNYYNSYYSTNNLSNTKSYFGSSETRWALGLGGAYKITRSVSVMLAADYQKSLDAVSNSQPNGYNGTTSMGLSTVTYGFNTGLILDI